MKESGILSYYEPALARNHFIPSDPCDRFNSEGKCWQLSPDLGSGYYWVYSKDNLFDIKIHDFSFHEDFFMEFTLPRLLSITQYESISGEELQPYRRLTKGKIRTYIGGLKPYKAMIHKKIPIKCIGIEIMPAYYEDYLKKQYPDYSIDPLSAFQSIDETASFPKMAKLLHEVKAYRGTGIAAALFYEGKVAEAVSLIVEEQKNLSAKHTKPLSSVDKEQLENVIRYLDDHYAFDVPLERLSKIACMGTTKLKLSFKQMQSQTITSYIRGKRMGQAEALLTNTDLTVGQVAQSVGYSTSSRFAKLFKESTGLLPMEYRKMIRKNRD